MQCRRNMRNPSTRAKMLSVVAVLLMVFSAFTFAFFSFSDAARDDIVKIDTSGIVYDQNRSCLEVEVVYHPYYGTAPTVINDTNKTDFGVKYILDGDNATVLYIPDGVTLDEGDTVDGHTVVSINTDVKKTYEGVKFIETDESNHSATLLYNPKNLALGDKINHETAVYTVTAIKTTIYESAAVDRKVGIGDMSKSITCYGNVVSTEYNPQAWEYEYERWYAITNYQVGQTLVFTGWKFATAGTFSQGEFSASAVTGSAYDPGDIIKYSTADGHWYADSTRVDMTDEGTVQIHAYATWDTLENLATNPSSDLNWNSGSKYQNIVLISTSVRLSDIEPLMKGSEGYTVRAADMDNVYVSQLVSHKELAMGHDLIIDNITTYYVSAKAGASVNINANSHVMILGDGINAIKSPGEKNGTYGTFLSVHGGNEGDTKTIIHSGVYSNICGGGKTGYTSVTILNGGTVLDSVYGGNPMAKTSKTGDLYLYITGMVAYSDRYTDYLMNHEWAHIAVSGEKLDVIESSMIIGGNGVSEATSTHICLTGTSDVWTIQAAGRQAKSSITGDANMEISGKAVVRNVACGAITDAKPAANETSPVTGNINLSVRDTPMIATLAGGGYDTWESSVGASYLGGDINITLDGGIIGYVYGGGLRGPIGTAKNPVDITVTINSGTTVVKDVYGGGSGTLVKIKHTATTGSIETNNASKDTTGLADVHGNVTINMNNGTINGSLYGGGKSVPAISKYNTTSFSGIRDSVAAVYGDVTVNVSGGTVLKDIYGAGRGIDTSLLADGQNAADNEYSSLYVIMNKTENGQITDKLEFGTVPWALQDLFSNTKIKVTFNKSDLTRYEEYASVSGDVHLNVSGGTVSGGVYGGSALGKVYGHTYVHITGGTIEGTVYGGGLGVEGRVSVSGKRWLTVGGTAHIKGSVYGGSALGTDGLTMVIDKNGKTVDPGDTLIYDPDGEVEGDEKKYTVSIIDTDVKTVSTGTASGAKFVVVNGCALIVDPNGKSVKAGDTVTSGSTSYVVKGVNTTIYTAATPAGVQFITTSSDSIMYLKAGTVDGSVFGGGFKGITYGDTHIFVGKDSLNLAENDVLPDINPQTSISIGESIYLGGDVGVITSSSEAYIDYMVMGGGELYFANDPSLSNVAFTGSIMGSGNSCLTRGETTIYVKDFITFADLSAESIHRATNVTIDGCVLELDGRATVENTLANVNNTQYSLYRIEHLNLKNGALLVFNAAVDYIYELNSLNPNGDPAPATSPSNKIVVGGGNMFILKEIDWGPVPSKGETFVSEETTYTVTSINTNIHEVPDGTYAGAKYIVTDGRNVTVIDKNGTSISNGKTFLVGGATYKVTAVNEDVRQISEGIYDGMKFIITSGTDVTIIDYIVYTESYGMANGYTILSDRSNENYGVLALGDPDSSGGFVILRNGTFQKADYSDLSESCRCWYLAGAINNEVTVTAGYDDSKLVSVSMPSLQSNSKYRYTGGTFVPDSPGVNGYLSTAGEHPLTGEFQVRFGLDDGENECLVFADDPLHPELGALMRNDFGQLDPILGDLEGKVSVRDPYMIIEVESLISQYRYLGYVLLYVNEVVTVDLGGTPSYVVVNTIQTKVHIYTEAASLSDTSMDISIVDGVGNSVFTIPSGMAGCDVEIRSVTAVDGATGVSAFNITAVKNANNTPGWTNSLGTFVLRTDGSAPATTVGTLQGGYSASMNIEVNAFTGSGTEYYQLAIRILDNGVLRSSFTLTLAVSKTPDISITFHVNEDTELKYTYSYGTVVTLPDCPPTDANFVGWYTDRTFNNPYTFTLPVTKSLDLYARYMYTVTMDYMDGTSSVVYVTMPSGVIGSMADPVRPGYTFDAWYTETEYENIWNLESDSVDHSMTLYARWTGWDVKVKFQWGETPVDLDASKAEHHDGDLLNCQIMKFGTRFNTYDTFTIPGEGEQVMTLLEWAQYNLEKIPAYSAGHYKFIYWTYQVTDASGRVVPVYTDSYLTEVERLLTNGSGQYQKEDGYYVVVLTAKVSKIAVSIQMDSTVIIEGQSVDNLALVDPPASFLIFPADDTAAPYTMTIALNGATRPGYSLRGWSIANSADGSFVFVDRGEPEIYPAGTVITLNVITNTGGDSATYPFIGQFKVSGSVVETIKITSVGSSRMQGNESQNLIIEFQSEWSKIPYSVSIATPAHGTVFATYYDEHTGTYIPFSDTTFYYGDRVYLIFTPDAGYQFHHWYSSGEGMFESESNISTTYIVQGDTNLSAYLIGPQIVKVFIEFEGLYQEVALDGTVSSSGTEYTVKSINTSILAADNGVRFIVTGGTNVTVIYAPAHINVQINDELVVNETTYHVTAINSDILSDPELGARFIVTDDVNHYATVIEYYVDESLIPNLYWKNGGTKVYFTESVYIADMGANDHTLVVYIGTATLGSHDIYLEGRSFYGEYDLGMPITSTTLQNVYYIMTDRELHSLAELPDTTPIQIGGVDYIVTDRAENGVSVSHITSNDTVISISATFTYEAVEYTVIGIGPDALKNGEQVTCPNVEKLTVHGDTIYRYGFITVYSNGVKNHVTNPYCDDLAGIGTGISALKEYVLGYYIADNPEIDTSTDITLTLEPGHYYFNSPGDSTHIDNSTATAKTITVTSFVSNRVVVGTITRENYTFHIYYGTGNPDASGTYVTESEVYYGDSYLDKLSEHRTVPATTYSVYAWYIQGNEWGLISSSMIVDSNTPNTPIVIYGKYVASNTTATIWIRTEELNSQYTVESPLTVESNGHVYYCVDAKPGFDAKYDTDASNVVTEQYLRTKVYASSVAVTQNPIDVQPGAGNVVIITYYRAVVTVTITDATRTEAVEQYKYGQTVALVHHADTAETHYSGWTRNGSDIDIPVEGYSISLADTLLIPRAITLAEASTVREYTVSLLTAQATISSGGNDLGKAVSLSIPYGTAVSKSGEYNSTLTIGGVTYAISGYGDLGDYYVLSSCDWTGVPATVTGDVTMSYQWVPRTYTLRIVYDDTVTVSGSNSSASMLFGNVSYVVKLINDTILTVESGDYEGVQYILSDNNATVIYVPDGKTVNVNDTVEGHTVVSVNTVVKETSAGIRFIVTDWTNRYVTVVDTHGETVAVDDTLVQDGPEHTVTVTPTEALGYGANIRLTLVFSGSYTIDDRKSTYINPAGGSYALTPTKQSSLQNYTLQFFVTGDMEITIVSKWVGEQVNFYIQGTEGGEPVIDRSMTLLKIANEPLYIKISDYEYIAGLSIDGYYFDGWYVNTSYTRQPTVAMSGGEYCFRLTGNTSLYARYVPLVSGDYAMTYDGTAQSVSVKPETNVPLNMSAVSYTYEGGSGSEISITNVNDTINNKTINYTFTPSKIYTMKEGGVDHYVMCGAEGRHAYSWHFTLVMSPREAIVIAGSASKIYDGTELTRNAYSVYGLVGNDSIGASVTVTGGQTAVGWSANTATVNTPNANYSITCYKGTLFVMGPSLATATLTTSADDVVLTGSDPISVVYSESSVTVTQGTFEKTFSGNTVKIAIYGDTNITASGVPAVSIGEGCNVTLAIHGDCTFIGGTGYDGIAVASNASLTVTGSGSLIVKGNGGSDSAGAGSGIGLVSGTPGAIVIGRMASLSAYGYGEVAYGIGGIGATVTIEDSTVTLARGGLAGGADNLNGGPGIGGRIVTIRDSVVTSAVGGPNAAAIGGRNDTTVNVEIVRSEIVSAQGGSYSAGVGGGRQTSEDATRSVTIRIEESSVTATGGINGPGIGIGGATVYTDQGECYIRIENLSSVNSTGGQYAASIGTGYRHAILTGFIDGTVSVTTPARSSSVTILDSDHTVAQNIGYGVLDPTSEGDGLTVYFYRVFTPTETPAQPS